MKYKEWLSDWLTLYIKPSVKSRTYEKYEETLRLHIIPALGETDMSELTAVTLQRFIVDLSTNGNKKNNAGLSANTVNGIITVLQSSLKQAVALGIADKQYADKIQCPKSKEKAVECFTLTEQKKIENYILNDKKPKLFGIVLCLYTGLRIGELLALEWSDKAFVAENVKGLLTANKHKAIETIIHDFENIAPGYIVKPHLYNFAEYGVPQFRERLLIVGIRIDTGFDFKHPKPTHGPNGTQPYVTAGQAIEGALDVPYNNEAINCKDKTRRMLELIPEGGNFTDIPKDNPLYVKGMISHVYRRIDRNEPAKTIIAAGGGGTWGYHYPEPRPLTNRERARLQSFPDDFKFMGNITEVRRQIGNAVPPVGVRAVARKLMPLFTGDYTPLDLKEEYEHLKTLSVKERLDFVTKEME